MLKLIKTSVIGPGHVRDALPNQDAVGHFINENHWAIIICDGMGSRPYADIGASTAVNSIKHVLKHSPFNILAKSVISDFYQHWLNTLKQRGIRPKDAVTTVLIAWGNHQGDFRTFQLGDGVICTPSRVVTPISTDEFSNLTTGLGLSKQFSDWSVCQGILSKEGNGILLMSDGISEDIAEHCPFAQALIAYSRNKSSRRIKHHLKNMLIHWPTPHHTDDKSLTMVILYDKN
ncbi:MAG: serine/threonine protein phosphatase PrpC [Oleiphilaceae bacterium]|jgi:serine/threonine protein phosphatase PrpC